MRRQWIVPVLMLMAVIGAVLVATASDESTPPLDAIVTEQGLRTRIPQGWVASADRPFEFAPPGAADGFDQWIVTSACPADGCGPRTLEEWFAEADGLATFDNILEAEGDAVFNIEAEDFTDARVLRARTEAGGRLVFVAAFTDGARSYVECSARVAIDGDQRLADTVVDVCRSTEPLD